METPEERAWREAYQSGMQPGSEACPGDEALAALVLGELSGDERAALARHVSECRRCAETYRALRALHAETGSVPPRRRMRWPAVAAAVVLAAGLGVTLIWLERSGGPGSVDDTVRGDVALEEMVRPADGAVLEAAPSNFSWPDQAGATAYRLRLYDETAELLWEGPVARTASSRLLPQVASGLATGDAYFWTVEVEGVVARRELGPYWFRLAE